MSNALTVRTDQTGRITSFSRVEVPYYDPRRPPVTTSYTLAADGQHYVRTRTPASTTPGEENGTVSLTAAYVGMGDLGKDAQPITLNGQSVSADQMKYTVLANASRDVPAQAHYVHYLRNSSAQEKKDSERLTSMMHHTENGTYLFQEVLKDKYKDGAISPGDAAALAKLEHYGIEGAGLALVRSAAHATQDHQPGAAAGQGAPSASAAEAVRPELMQAWLTKAARSTEQAGFVQSDANATEGYKQVASLMNKNPLLREAVVQAFHTRGVIDKNETAALTDIMQLSYDGDGHRAEVQSKLNNFIQEDKAKGTVTPSR